MTENDKYLPIKIAVRTIIVDDNQRIMFVKRSQGSFEGGRWCLPGGNVEQYETAEQAGYRENIEELDTTYDLTYFDTFENPNVTDGHRWITHYFTARSDGPPTQFAVQEISDADFFALDEIGSLDIAFDHRDVVLDYLLNQK